MQKRARKSADKMWKPDPEGSPTPDEEGDDIILNPFIFLQSFSYLACSAIIVFIRAISFLTFLNKSE